MESTAYAVNKLSHLTRGVGLSSNTARLFMKIFPALTAAMLTFTYHKK